VIQGGAEVVFELNQIIEHAGRQRAFLQYCRLTTAPKAVVAKDMATANEENGGSSAGAGRLAAYAYAKTGNAAFVARAVSQLGGLGGPRHVLNPIEEAPFVSTNTTAQSSLTAIQVLELCQDHLPAELPAAPGPRG